MRLRPIGIHFGYLAEQVLERVRRGEDSVFSIDDVERRLGLAD
jgi:RHH-type rel operon transcriptional repressor/antitoxin RelB